jgi:hypothetical protein
MKYEKVKKKSSSRIKINLTPFKVRSNEEWSEGQAFFYLFISSICLMISYKVSMKNKISETL